MGSRLDVREGTSCLAEVKCSVRLIWVDVGLRGIGEPVGGGVESGQLVHVE